ncbi:dipeptide epimerase [Rufibacter quisquiliarum]|uniref:Dipeptide epimerase n=1 Tax=Rufibacter quisquiliarum TaxID=1549639 RepID=A0A839GEJ4_9BACT|nr:dipeptide epimerase [Rufibacter quisquiliarum]MBA9075953.1 L-alanine-DL-glutamate epimerase-like enolase superfamily enzyme [Rufibacter quisquiliarum]
MAPTQIVSVRFQPLNLPLKEPFAIATGTQYNVENVLVQVELSSGIVGLGEAAPFPAVSGETQESTLSTLKGLEPMLLGKDVREWRTLAKELSTLAYDTPAARCGVEMALLDALCQQYNMPLYVFFGGVGTELSTDLTITAGDEAHAAASAKSIVDRGFSVIKVKTEGVDVDYDIRRLQAIHTAAPQATLIVDGNCGYDLARAQAFVHKAVEAKLPIILLEQPLARENWEDLNVLATSCPFPIAADESARSAEDVARLAQDLSAAVVNIKLMKCGVLEALQMAALAQVHGLGLMIGGMVESLLAMTFSAHFAAGIGGFDFVDLDTPLFIAEHPFTGGFDQNGPSLRLQADVAGHGVKMAAPMVG